MNLSILSPDRLKAAYLTARDALLDERTPDGHWVGELSSSALATATAALAGLVEWREVPPLPFELACFPQSWFRFLGLPVVSYALPALIAIGQAVAYRRPSRNPVTRLVRWLARAKSLRVLQAIQPTSG